jgi:hypothetical protein
MFYFFILFIFSNGVIVLTQIFQHSLFIIGHFSNRHTFQPSSHE